MGEKIFVGPMAKGLKTNPLAFYIDNDSFPFLQNAYAWRGRIKRKRGTSALGRLTRYINSAVSSYGVPTSFNLAAGAGNFVTSLNLDTNASLVAGTINFTDSTSGQTFTDSNGILTGSGGATGTINYATGAFTISGAGNDTITAITLDYYPDLPVMGLEDLNLNATQFPGTIAFDTVYSYNINTSSPYNIYDVSFYKNPAASGSLPGYVPKTTPSSVNWNGQDYQQFWTTNYQGAMWATNGIPVPFSGGNIGMQFKTISNITNITAGPPASCRITIGSGHGLVIGDFVFINEVMGVTGINFQTGYVTSLTGATQINVTFPNATLGGAYTSGGIVQYLTSNAANTSLDCLRWYDGDPFSGSPPTFAQGSGWVNFCPPLSQSNYIIDDAPSSQYYLVGARTILPFKDRILFFGPVIQSSSSSRLYLQDTVIYSQNGTAYYTTSYTNSPSASVDTPTNSTITFNPILVPVNQTATSPAYFEDSPGFGGFITAGFAQPIVSVSPNEDTLIIGFTNRQTRFVYTGNDLIPFNFYVVNSEFGTSSTFSVVTLDRGVITTGDRGIVLSNQISSQRIDIDIPDQIFEFSLSNNGSQRVTAQRDYINEWIFFSYSSNEFSNINKYPTQTLQYNYRENSWGIFNETYTTYGQFRKSTGLTWAALGNDPNLKWSNWNVPWNSGSTTLFQPLVIAGNQQGFVIIREQEGTDETDSLYIQSFSGNTVTSPAHGLNDADYIVINNCLGTISSQVNGNIFQVTSVTTDTFALNPSISSGTYFGGGTIERMYVPLAQTKQFPLAWSYARKTRIGPQQYLFSTTENGKIQLQIYLSQNILGEPTAASNFGSVYPSVGVINNSLVYSDTLYTCPESTNLGLTAANINLQMVTAISPSEQQQIWHRMNTSLLGDTVQIGFTLSDTQMRDITFSNQFAEIELHGFIIDVSPSQLLA